MINWLKGWWHGKYIEPPKPNSHDAWIIMTGCYEKHWTSKLAHMLVKFYLEHWKFIWGSIVAIFCASIKFL